MRSQLLAPVVCARSRFTNNVAQLLKNASFDSEGSCDSGGKVAVMDGKQSSTTILKDAMAEGRDKSRSPSSMSLRQQFAEAATSHPLESSSSTKSESLSPPPAPAQAPGTSPTTSSAAAATAPYAVYHRASGSRSSLNLTGAVPSPPVSSPTVSSMASSRAGPESATSKLQFQTLQGQVQSAGIKSESLGWAFLLSLVHNEPALKSSLKGKERENELGTWQRIVDVLQDPKDSLKEDLDLIVLLPKAARDKFSVAALASHVLLAKAPKASPASSAAHASQTSSYRHVVTLSGLRGCIQGYHHLTGAGTSSMC